MCVNVLGVPHQAVHGADSEKNQLVPHLLWENFPVPVWDHTDGRTHIQTSHVPEFPCLPSPEESIISEGTWHRNHTYWFPGPCDYETKETTIRYGIMEDGGFYTGMWNLRSGPMTAREVLQYWGTDIFRKQYKTVWADSCIRSISKFGHSLNIITDCRFEDEVFAVQAAGGKVVRLTRKGSLNDKHESETSLDREFFDQNRFDAILDNETFSLADQKIALQNLFYRWGIS